MAHPKHKVSSTRRDKRRTHYKAVVPTVVTCSNCGAATLYHRVCPECGFYRGKLAIEKKAAEEAKKGEAEDVLKKLLANGMTAEEILAKLQ